jgi:hypothetical protein
MSDTQPEQQIATPPSYTATAVNYVVNALELPANQNAAALFLGPSGANPSGGGIVDTTKWASSPMGTGVGGGTSSFGDVPSATRDTVAKTALTTENTRLTNQATGITNAQTAIANLQALP